MTDAPHPGYRYRHVLDGTARGHTTLSYLVATFRHSTEFEWQARLDAGEILVDDTLARGSEPLRPGAVLVWNRPGWVEAEVPQSYTLIHQDDDLIVVDKPSGLPTLPGGGFYQHTLLSLVQRDFPEARPLHRLGRATSGLVLFALNSPTAATLSRQWPQVEKQYLALASGIAALLSYDIQMPIGPVPHPRLGTVHAASPSGKPAHSVARVVRCHAESTLFEVDLFTGRPHQIRIHLAAIGHPLVGDPIYEAGGLPRAVNPGLPGDSGYWLHAGRVRFTHPKTGERVEFTAASPTALR
ncbi:MAG: RluA family pseudouridine synthase [Planctomycetota bacterium]|nr:RluA family pseudouridine synthase [Planctomycetota bacterium]